MFPKNSDVIFKYAIGCDIKNQKNTFNLYNSFHIENTIVHIS